MDDLIEEILAELPDPVPEGQQFTDPDDQVPLPVRLPADRCVEILNDAKDEFEVDGVSTWRMEDDPFDIGDIEITDSMHARAGRLALNAQMTDVRATQLLAALPESNVILRLRMMIWSLKTSLIQSRLSERSARGSSRSLGTQSLACLPELTACSTKMPTLSPQLPTAYTPSETRTLPTLLR